VWKRRNVGPINLSLSSAVKINLIPAKRALDKGDASDLSVEDRLGLRRQDLAHRRDQALLQRRKPVSEKAESLEDSHHTRSRGSNTKVTDSGAHGHPHREQVHPPLFGSEPG
jgi:hypothetical protein